MASTTMPPAVARSCGPAPGNLPRRISSPTNALTDRSTARSARSVKAAVTSAKSQTPPRSASAVSSAMRRLACRSAVPSPSNGTKAKLANTWRTAVSGGICTAARSQSASLCKSPVRKGLHPATEASNSVSGGARSANAAAISVRADTSWAIGIRVMRLAKSWVIARSWRLGGNGSIGARLQSPTLPNEGK